MLLRSLKAAAFACALAGAGTAHADPSSEPAAARKAVTDLLDSWREADAAKGDAVLHKDFRYTTLREIYDGDDPARKGEAPSVDTATRDSMMGVYRGLKPGSWDDRLTGVSVHVDDTGHAMVWGRYRFSIEGKLTHCGAASFQLYRMKSGWQIVSFADSHFWTREAGNLKYCPDA